MKTRVLVTDGLGKEGLELLKTHPNFEVVVRDQTSASELSELAPKFDALIIRTPTKITRDVLTSAPRLKLVVSSGAGFDNIDTKAAREKTVVVMNCPTANSLSAAEHTIGLFFALARHIPQSNTSLRLGKWERDEPFYGTELHGKVLGIIGLGNVGKIVAEKAMALGMLVLAYDSAVPALSFLPEKFKYLEMRFKLCRSQSEVLREADWVTLHIPKEERNIDLLNATTIGEMKRGTYLLNVSRGGIVNEAALLEALRSGHLRGAACDVFASEPPNFESDPIMGLLAHPAFIGTAHLGGATTECRERIAAMAAKQTLAFFNDGARMGVVN
ncbi:MAG: hydroxyacid dehydrogenase [Cryobacterium sp.]|nr:hydroxyacid dehydrogenase [Oligoflexia bacterium]